MPTTFFGSLRRGDLARRGEKGKTEKKKKDKKKQQEGRLAHKLSHFNKSSYILPPF